MKYEILWHDAEDERSGNPLTVEAETPTKAYWIAVEELSRVVKGFHSVDIEMMVDEEGNYHHPDVFLDSKTEWRRELLDIRNELSRGDNVTQERINSLVNEWSGHKEELRGGEKDEPFLLVNKEGQSLQVEAPRWLCHLLGLRHRCAHVLLRWESPTLGAMLVLQVRSWNKSDSPGHLDISVGGHVKGDATSEETAYQEMKEEFGISKNDLEGNKLRYVGGYESYNERKDEDFFNAEWRDVYVGDLASINSVAFEDDEVVGMYLCPESQSQNLLRQTQIPIASALELSLPRVIKAQ